MKRLLCALALGLVLVAGCGKGSDAKTDKRRTSADKGSAQGVGQKYDFAKCRKVTITETAKKLGKPDAKRIRTLLLKDGLLVSYDVDGVAQKPGLMAPIGKKPGQSTLGVYLYEDSIRTNFGRHGPNGNTKGEWFKAPSLMKASEEQWWREAEASVDGREYMIIEQRRMTRVKVGNTKASLPMVWYHEIWRDTGLIKKRAAVTWRMMRGEGDESVYDVRHSFEQLATSKDIEHTRVWENVYE